ncbi:helix-turn-helix domain-containing protein [Myxococcus stipitatus]|uniref:helix-turn-helix domain-containing protein n=1 Tax=Myxococcus stipitatus TaxID=83455 RepID=UPI0031451C06
MNSCPPYSSLGGPDFLTVEEAAVLLRVNRKTLYEAIRLGQVPGVVRVGKTLRICRALLVGLPLGQGGPALKEKHS